MLQFYLAMIETEEERDKFTLLYQRYYNLMIKIAFDLLHSGEDAEDAVQQAFLKLIPNLGKLDDVSSHQTKFYLVTVVERVCYDIYNEKNEISLVPFDSFHSRAQDDVKDEFIEQIQYAELLAKIKSLPIVHSEVLCLMYCDDFSVKDIASLLGVSINATKKRLERARCHLKVALLDEEV